MELLTKIQELRATVGIIGLGNIGLPLLVEFCNAGFPVIGFDVDEGKIRLLNAGKTHLKLLPSDLIRDISKNSNFRVTSDYALLKDADCIIVCVPAPLSKHGEPNHSYMAKTMETIAKYLRKGHLVILESTAYPGTTDDEMRLILETSGLKAGRDFHLSCSPDREEQDDKLFATSSIPKIVGGYTPSCLKLADALYRKIVRETAPVVSNKVAEAVKLLEHSYQAVNTALMNELKMLFDRMDIDIWEVIETAKKKPFGFQPFYPGLGLGGHSSSLDPFYLTWKARAHDFHTKIIELAGEVNTSMPYYVTGKIIDELNYRGKSINTSKILILGLTNKKDVNDTRESPSLKLIEVLMRKGAHVDYNDPYIPLTRKSREYNLEMTSASLTEENLRGYDCVVVATDHSSYDYQFIANHASLIVDTRNAMSGFAQNGNVVKA